MYSMFQAVFTCFSAYLGIGRRVGGSPKGLVHNLLMEFFTLDSSKLKFSKFIFLDTVFAQAEHKKNCTELGMAVLKYHQGRAYRRLYGRVRRGPLRWMRDPTLVLTLTLYPGPHAAARLDPPLKP